MGYGDWDWVGSIPPKNCKKWPNPVLIFGLTFFSNFAGRVRYLVLFFGRNFGQTFPHLVQIWSYLGIFCGFEVLFCYKSVKTVWKVWSLINLPKFGVCVRSNTSDKNDDHIKLFDSVLEDILYGTPEFFPPEEFSFKIKYYKRNSLVKETPQYFIV